MDALDEEASTSRVQESPTLAMPQAPAARSGAKVYVMESPIAPPESRSPPSPVTDMYRKQLKDLKKSFMVREARTESTSPQATPGLVQTRHDAGTQSMLHIPEHANVDTNITIYSSADDGSPAAAAGSTTAAAQAATATAAQRKENGRFARKNKAKEKDIVYEVVQDDGDDADDGDDPSKNAGKIIGKEDATDKVDTTGKVHTSEKVEAIDKEYPVIGPTTPVNGPTITVTEPNTTVNAISHSHSEVIVSGGDGSDSSSIVNTRARPEVAEGLADTERDNCILGQLRVQAR